MLSTLIHLCNRQQHVNFFPILELYYRKLMFPGDSSLLTTSIHILPVLYQKKPFNLVFIFTTPSVSKYKMF
jgi:hypothetical protein